jgi:RNase P subunit RPR2
MLARLLDVLFGCWHSRYSFPITVRARSRSQVTGLAGTYVVCLDCGKEMPYDWNEMRVVSASARSRSQVQSLATKEAG